MRVLKTFENYDGGKIWINNKDRWEKIRRELEISDEGENWSKGGDDKLNSFWSNDREEGWIRKSTEPVRVKTFENHVEDLSKQIATDLLPELKKIREEKGKFTTIMFDNFMSKNGGDLSLVDDVMSHLVDMGFDFDTVDDVGEEDIDILGYNLN